MWKDYKPEDITGQNQLINKVELVRDFLDRRYVEKQLTNSEGLSSFLKNEIKSNFGIYCLYDKKNNEVLYVGESARLKTRIREQLIGTQNRKTGLLYFTRLFYAILKFERGMMEKDYSNLSIEEKVEHVTFYQNIIFRPINTLRVCFSDNRINAIILEDVLIKYFKKRNQCKYNFQSWSLLSVHFPK